jgi:flagellar M-ring protein FliF
MAGFNDITEQAQQFWATRTAKQRAFLLGGAAATVLLLVLFVRMLNNPDYKPLYKDMEPADAQALATQLDAESIPHQISADGKSISVPADKLDAARLQTAQQGQPHSGRMGFEIFDKVSWGQTEFDEKVAYQRALEGELERTIQTLSDVESARVHLVLPTDSVFVDRQRTAKASVIIKLRHDSLSKDAVVAISRLVAGAVDELKPEDVAIIDADSDRSLGLSHDASDFGAGEEARLTEQLVNTLEPVVGKDKIRASVNIDYDQDTTDESQEKYDPTVSALLSDQRSEDQAGNAPAQTGVPGTASNIPAAKNNAPKPVQTQSSKTENAQYGVNKTVVHTVMPAGRIQRVTAALLVDDATVRTAHGSKVTLTHRKRTPEELAKIRELAEAAIGFDPKRGDTISVQDMPFDGDAADAEVPSLTWTAEAQKAVTDYSSLLRPLSLLGLFMLAYLFVLRPMQKQVLSSAPTGADGQPALGAARGQALMGAPGPSDDAKRAAQLKEQTIELIRQKPLGTARAMQAWMREEPS